MKMIPPVVFDFKSAAEKKLFDLLKQSSFSDSCVALHSLNLSKHIYKQWAEADFVVVCPEGIFILEVKGGRVKCDEGIWKYTDRYGDTHRKSESPFDQARTARFSVEDVLKEVSGASFVDGLCFGWAVAFPDIPFEVKSAEFDRAMVLDRPTCKQGRLEQAIKKLAKYWAEKTGNHRKLKDGDISKIVRALRPVFDLVPKISTRVEMVQEHLLALTNEQYIFLDAMVDNHRVIVEGGAGSGKTVLAMEAARRIASYEKRVLLVCRNRMLASLISVNLEASNVKVMHVEQLGESIRRGFLRSYDCLVVDEGQDLLDLESMTLLEQAVTGGFEKGRWLYCMDSNNQGSFYTNESDLIGIPASENSTKLQLTRNVRNTGEIATHTVLYTGAKMGKVREGPGIDVDDRNYYSTEEQLAEMLYAQVSTWFEDSDVEPSDITILSCVDYEESVVSKLPHTLRNRISRIDENTAGRKHSGQICFSSIKDFKGLESLYITIVDLDKCIEKDERIRLLYVGMTRATAVLWMAIPRGLKKEILSMKKNNAYLIGKLKL